MPRRNIHQFTTELFHCFISTGKLFDKRTEVFAAQPVDFLVDSQAAKQKTPKAEQRKTNDDFSG